MGRVNALRDLNGLTPREQVFVREYILDMNAGRAAEACGHTGPKERLARIGYGYLHRDHVLAALQRALDAKLCAVDLRGDRTITELSRIAFANLARCYNEKGDLLHVRDMPLDVQQAISSIEVVTRGRAAEQGKPAVQEYVTKIKLWPKTHAIELALKYLRLIGQGDAVPLDPNAVEVPAFSFADGDTKGVSVV